MRRTHVKMFLSLHNAMSDVSALVTVKQRHDLPPRLALLVPIDDQDGPDGTQVLRPVSSGALCRNCQAFRAGGTLRSDTLRVLILP